MFQCVEDLIECLDGLLSLGGVHPFEKAFDEGIVLQGMFRAPLDHRMRIAPLVTAVARIPIDSGAITRDSTSLPGGSGYKDLWSERAGPMSLWMHWWNAIWRLRPAFSRLQTFLWFATAVAGFTVRTELRWSRPLGRFGGRVKLGSGCR